MRWSWAVQVVGAAVLLAAAAMLTMTVSVSTPRGVPAACGSAWDVIAGRAGWQQWWAQDRITPIAGVPLARTYRCPSAVNDRIVIGAVLGFAGAAALVVGGVSAGRRPGRPGPEGRRLRAFGAAIEVVGGLLTIAGLVGLALLTADPTASLFIYVNRTSVVLLGLLLILPAVLLVVLGRSLRLLADRLDDRGPASGAPHETA